MKKHLIAAAVAGALAVPAMAQVTVYGILDMGYSMKSTEIAGVKTDTDAINAPVAGLSGSRLGFKGEEDLGGGLKASFVFETALNTAGASFAGGDRGANIALSGGFGTVRIGRQNTPGKSLNDGFSAFGGGASFEQGMAAFEATRNKSGVANAPAKALTPTVDRASQAVSYTTPSMGGLSAVAAIVRNTVDTDGAVNEVKTEGYAVSLGYSAGPLKAAVAYTTIDTSAATDVVDNEHEMLQVGASFNLGAATIYALYNDGEYTKGGATKAAGLESQGFDVGLKYAMGSTTLLASIGQGESDNTTTEKLEFDAYQLQIHQALSKRTTVYALYGMTDYDTTVDNKDSVTMIGVRHSF
jgi:predicted porin